MSGRPIRRAGGDRSALYALSVAVFAPPALGRASPLLPMAVQMFFAAQIGSTIALFGGVYAWLALQP